MGIALFMVVLHVRRRNLDRTCHQSALGNNRIKHFGRALTAEVGPCLVKTRRTIARPHSHIADVGTCSGVPSAEAKHMPRVE